MQEAPAASDADTETPFRRFGAKVGHNDPCPCGSGRRYELCHGLHLLGSRFARPARPVTSRETLELAPSTEEEKQGQLAWLHDFQARHAAESGPMLARLQQAVALTRAVCYRADTVASRSLLPVGLAVRNDIWRGSSAWQRDAS